MTIKTRRTKKNLDDASKSTICFDMSHFISVMMTIFVFLQGGERTVLMLLSFALSISLPFMDGTHDQEQPLNDSFKLILSLK